MLLLVWIYAYGFVNILKVLGESIMYSLVLIIITNQDEDYTAADDDNNNINIIIIIIITISKDDGINFAVVG